MPGILALEELEQHPEMAEPAELLVRAVTPALPAQIVIKQAAVREVILVEELEEEGSLPMYVKPPITLEVVEVAELGCLIRVATAGRVILTFPLPLPLRGVTLGLPAPLGQVVGVEVLEVMRLLVRGLLIKILPTEGQVRVTSL